MLNILELVTQKVSEDTIAIYTVSRPDFRTDFPGKIAGLQKACEKIKEAITELVPGLPIQVEKCPIIEVLEIKVKHDNIWVNLNDNVILLHKDDYDIVRFTGKPMATYDELCACKTFTMDGYNVISAQLDRYSNTREFDKYLQWLSPELSIAGGIGYSIAISQKSKPHDPVSTFASHQFIGYKNGELLCIDKFYMEHRKAVKLFDPFSTIVYQLREKTGHSLTECVSASKLCNGNLDNAENYLRTHKVQEEIDAIEQEYEQDQNYKLIDSAIVSTAPTSFTIELTSACGHHSVTLDMGPHDKDVTILRTKNVEKAKLVYKTFLALLGE